jgi:hypothetical protein
MAMLNNQMVVAEAKLFQTTHGRSFSVLCRCNSQARSSSIEDLLVKTARSHLRIPNLLSKTIYMGIV